MSKSKKKKVDETISAMYHDSFYSAVKSGISTNFLIPFAIALNASSEYIAIIASAPQLIGSFFQLFAVDLMHVMKDRRKVIVITSAIDAILWIPILLIPFVWNSNYVLFLNFLILQSMATSMLNPFFNSLLGDVAPQTKRGSITGSINKITAIVSFVSSLISGLILALLNSNPFIGFAIIFTVAFISRSISTYIKTKYYDPSPKVKRTRDSLIKFSRNIRKSNFGQFVMYSSWMKFAVGISAPFFPVYMLTYLNWDFLTYSLVMGASIVSSFLILTKWGRELDKKGSRWMLGISGFLVPLVPVLWIIFKSPLVLFILEFFSGAVWAAFNLSTSTFIMDATNRHNRLGLTSYFNFFVGFMTFVGAYIGGLIIKNLPIDLLGNIFYVVFGVSAIARLAASAYFMPKIKEERFIGIDIGGPKSKRTVQIQPQQGLVPDYLPRKRK